MKNPLALPVATSARLLSAGPPRSRVPPMFYRLLLAAGTALGVAAGGSWLWRNSDATQAVGAQRPEPGAPIATAAIAVEVQAVTLEPFEVMVSATGTLLGRESVEIVSEL